MFRRAFRVLPYPFRFKTLGAMDINGGIVFPYNYGVVTGGKVVAVHKRIKACASGYVIILP